jgi:hypothetical protein
MVASDIDCSLDDVTKNVKEKAYITFKDALIHLCMPCYIFGTGCILNKFEFTNFCKSSATKSQRHKRALILKPYQKEKKKVVDTADTALRIIL